MIFDLPNQGIMFFIMLFTLISATVCLITNCILTDKYGKMSSYCPTKIIGTVFLWMSFVSGRVLKFCY